MQWEALQLKWDPAVEEARAVHVSWKNIGAK